MSGSRIGLALITVAVLCLTGCTARGPSSESLESETAGMPSPQDLTKEWLDLAKTAKDAAVNPRCLDIAAQLLSYGPEALGPLLDVIADPESDPCAKVWAVESLKIVLVPEMAPRLIALTAPGNEGTTRACATALLGGAQGKEVDVVLKKLESDPESRVRLAARCGLTSRDDAEARKALIEQYQHPDTTRPEREAILAVLAAKPQPGDLPVLKAGLGDGGISVPTRTLAIVALVRLGDPSAVEDLKKCAEGDTDSQLRATAKDAMESLVAFQSLPSGPATQ